MAEQYSDLGLGQDYNGQYQDIVIPNLDFETDYAFRVAWIYSDKTKGVSEWSERYNFTTDSESTMLAPHFISTDLYAINSILYINWDGLNSGLVPYDSSILKKVNVWIKGGDYGETYKQVHSFTAAGLHQINATQKTTYCVKLQAETKQDNFSAFSNEFCVTMLKQPKAVYDVRHEWDNSGNLSLFWKFDPTFKDATNDNTMADSFGLQLLDETNDVDATWWTAVEKDKIPPLEQKIIISANQLQKVFGQFTAFEIDYASFIYVRDKNLQTSLVTGYALTKYTDPLTAPVISATAAPMAYNVSYTANSAFDKIYIYESLDGGTTWGLTPYITSSNPAYVPALNTLQRSVRAKFSKKLGGFTGYSNVVTATPTAIDPTDTTPPSIPTVTSGSTTYNSIPITITTTDTSTRGYRIRYKMSTDTLYSPDHVLYSGANTSHTIQNLDSNKIYQIEVAAYDGANNTSAYSSAITATTAATVVPLVSNLTLSSLSYGLYASWSAPLNPTVGINNYRVELYNSSNALLQTLYSFTEVASFSGLSASTTYYVKVNAIDITGSSGNKVTSSNITLNAAGGSSDNSAPSSSPIPTVTSLYQALEIKWTAIANSDLVTYEVHVSTTNNFTPSSLTKSLETKGTFAVIKTLPGTSTSLTYGSTYYVKLIAKDFDGSAAASTQGSAQTLQVDNGDLATDSVRANVIKAGTITATEINSDSLLVGKLFSVGAGASDTHAIKIDASGATTKLYSGAGIYSDSGTPFYLDTTGKFSLQDRLFFSSGVLTVKGAIDATSGTISGAITLNNGTMKIGGNVNSTYDGIYINANSYWYSTGLFAVGTSATKFLEWTGTALKVTGEINALSGTITGNLNITSPGSLIAGTAGAPRVQMNSTGIFAYGNILVNNIPVLTQTTQILVDATTDAPTFITTRAKIGNWIVGTNSFSAGGITLNSSTPSIIATNSTSYVGIRPRQLDGTDIVLWAGNTETPALNSAASGHAGFQVNANGQMRATGAIISGVVELQSGSSLGGLVPDSSKVYYSGDTPIVPTGGHKQGDSWVDTANGNQLKIWSGTAWVITQDSAAALAAANLKTKTTYGPTQPTNSILGDVWYDTNTGINYFKVYNGTDWVRMKDSDITAAALAAANALTEANKKSTTTSSDSAPSSPKDGDIWFDTSFNYFKVYKTATTSWVRLKDGDLTAAQTAITAINTKADSALAKAVKFGADGSLASNLAVKFNSGTPGSINSSYEIAGDTFAKSTYSSNVPGYFLGWETGPGGAIYPAFNVGNDLAYLKYSNSNQILEVRGKIKATAGSFDGNVTAGAGAITIGPSGISSNKFSIDTAGNAYFSGTLQAGTILSEGTVTGSTITGGIIQTAPNSATRRIVMGSAQPDRIDFYPKSGDDADTPGYLWVSDDAGSATLPGLVLVPPTKSTWSTPPKIKMTQTSGGGLMDITAVQIALTGTVRINTYAYHVGNVAVATNAHRNISAGTTSPSGGNTGDVYIQY